MKFGSAGGREDAEHNGVGFVEISRIFTTWDTLFFRTEPFDGVYLQSRYVWLDIHSSARTLADL